MINFDKVFTVFNKNYKLVPLEIFGSDPYKQGLQAVAYKTLVSTLMSARTNDDTTLAASLRLFKIAPNVKKLSNLNESEIAKIIYPVGFYKTKAKHLKILANTLITNYKSSVPNTREELIKLPGVGRKTANLVLNRAFGIPAIAVDTHVHKITNMLGWVKTKTPEETEKALTKVLPEKYWPETNRLFVSIGRQFKTVKRVMQFLKENQLI